MLHVRHGGALTTVQDRGRSGWRHLGVAYAGALDAAQASLANRLVGNPADAAVLELTLRGPVLEFERPTRIALCGARIDVHFEDAHAQRHVVPCGRPVTLPAGTLRLGTIRNGLRVWLARRGRHRCAACARQPQHRSARRLRRSRRSRLACWRCPEARRAPNHRGRDTPTAPNWWIALDASRIHAGCDPLRARCFARVADAGRAHMDDRCAQQSSGAALLRRCHRRDRRASRFRHLSHRAPSNCRPMANPSCCSPMRRPSAAIRASGMSSPPICRVSPNIAPAMHCASSRSMSSPHALRRSADRARSRGYTGPSIVPSIIPRNADTAMPRIDFNCDLGEGCGDDAAIMPWISSANIACGAHAGDDATIRETLRLCRAPRRGRGRASRLRRSRTLRPPRTRVAACRAGRAGARSDRTDGLGWRANRG